MRTAIAYLRVSTEELAESGYGLVAQRQSVEDYADRHGYQITAVFIE